MLRTVLLVDDSDPDLIYSQVILERAAIAARVVSFGTAVEALDHLASADGVEVDLVVLDINMPEMDGFEFLDRLQALEPHHAHVAVVMLTSSPDVKDRQRALAYSRVRDYVIKPLTLASAQHVVTLVKAKFDQGR